MSQTFTSVTAFTSAARLATAFKNYLTTQGIGVYPTGLNTSSTPYEITYSCNRNDLAAARPLLYVPHLRRPSPLRELFYSAADKPSTTEQGTLPNTYAQLQDQIDGVMKRLGDMTDPSVQVDMAVKELMHEPLNAQTTENADILLEAAILLSSQTDVEESIKRAIDLFVNTAMMRVFDSQTLTPEDARMRDAAAMVIQLALAASRKLPIAVPNRDNHQKLVELSDNAGDLWHRTSSPHQPAPDYAQNHSVRIFLGLIENFAAEVDINSSSVAHMMLCRIANLLKRSEEQYLKNDREDLAAKDSYRRLWALLNAVSCCDSTRVLVFDSTGIEYELKDVIQKIADDPNASAKLKGLAEEALDIVHKLECEALTEEMCFA